MAKQTVQYKRTIKGSVGAGMGAIFNANSRQYCILEHKSTSKYHQAGESQKIIVDQIELGRESHCQVRYDDASWPTVSRKHAAIIKDEHGWKIVPLSTTNSTIVNGITINKEWYLQNGDEIQLSINGPKIGFIIPAGKQSLVSSIRLTERLNLFRQQALRPYKTAIGILASLFVVFALGSGYKIHKNIQEINKTQTILAQYKESLKIAKAQNDSLKKTIEASDITIKKLGKELKLVKHTTNQLRTKTIVVNTANELKSCSNDVYFIQCDGCDVVLPDGQQGFVPYKWSGTAFLLNDGTFVTARHVVEPWFYSADKLPLQLNAISQAGGKVNARLTATSSSGNTIQLKTSDFNCNRSRDNIIVQNEVAFAAAPNDCTDFAYAKLSQKGKLQAKKELSMNLTVGTKLKILGFPEGLGATNGEITPLYSSADVAKSGLTPEGYILTTATGFEHGNSGGPVFADLGEGKLAVVGIVSAGIGRSTGFVVPISVIY